MSVVYISNMGPLHDYSRASVFGALAPITSGNYPIFKTGRLLEEITEKLIDSTADDFLLLSGSNTVAALCLAVWFAKHKRVRLLLFDRPNGYVERVISREEIHLVIEQVEDAKTKALQRVR